MVVRSQVKKKIEMTKNPSKIQDLLMASTETDDVCELFTIPDRMYLYDNKQALRVELLYN